MNSNKIVFVKNILYAFSAQIISLALSFVMSLVVPKLLGIEEYSYWQLFLFYSGYVGFFAFGFNDGLYLKLGGKDYDDLDYSVIGSQIKLNILIQSFVLVIVVCISNVYITDARRFLIILATAVFAVINNLNAYLGYIFQAVNQTRKFSLSTIIEKAFFLIVVICMMFLSEKGFEPFVLLYILAKCVALIYSIYNGRKIVFSKKASLKIVASEMIKNMSVGINLMLANIASMLILGFGRALIDRVWGLNAFGRFSLAISLCNFFLTFITQVSMVLFPALRQSNDNQIEKFYYLSRDALSVAMPLIFFLYTPMRILMEIWLPDYTESFVILGFLLPLCTYDSKMNLLCNTYFKVYRKEEKLLKVNILAVIISGGMAIVGVYILKSLYFIVFGMVFSIAIRSIVSEFYLAKMMRNNILLDIVLESVVVLLYLFGLYRFSGIMAFLSYAIVYIAYLIVNRNKLSNLARYIVGK